MLRQIRQVNVSQGKTKQNKTKHRTITVCLSKVWEDISYGRYLFR